MVGLLTSAVGEEKKLTKEQKLKQKQVKFTKHLAKLNEKLEAEQDADKVKLLQTHLKNSRNTLLNTLVSRQKILETRLTKLKEKLGTETDKKAKEKLETNISNTEKTLKKVSSLIDKYEVLLGKKKAKEAVN